MAIIPSLLKEMAREAETTRKMLALIPADKLDWQPHPKSMTLRALGTHIAEIPSWVSLVVTTREIDFTAEPYNPPAVSNAADLLALFEKAYADGHAQLEKSDEAMLEDYWRMRSGDQIHGDDPKLDALRGCFCQTVHHRAQLGVYLRLLNIPIPGSYGPSADELGL